MKIGILVQARMSSKRLPGKVLKPVRDRPLIDYLWTRLKQVETADVLALITSTSDDDDELAQFGEKCGLEVFRGDLHDVAKRFMEANNHFNLDAFVRINGDSPWMDPRLVERLLKIYKTGNYDLVTNVYKRTYPKGESVEILSSELLCQYYEDFIEEDFEHVTPYFYRHWKKLRGYSDILPDTNLSDVNLCIDTPGDFERLEKILVTSELDPDKSSWDQVVSCYRRVFPAKVRAVS